MRFNSFFESYSRTAVTLSQELREGGVNAVVDIYLCKYLHMSICIPKM